LLTANVLHTHTHTHTQMKPETLCSFCGQHWK